MSYDLIFLRKADDQSWEDAMEAAEEDDSDGPPSAEAWDQLLVEVRQLLGEVSVFAGADHYELDHDATGIQISYYAGEAGLTVPYWYRGQDARGIVEKIYQLGAMVQTATGLTGYDPQLELPLPEAAAQPDLAVRCFDQVADSFARRGFLSPSGG